MKTFLVTLSSLAILLGGCGGSGTTAPVTRNAPFVLIVPHTSVIGDVRGSNSIDVYKINPTTGIPALVAGSPFASGSDPTAAALDPSGKFAFVANKGSYNVSAYTVNATTGALRPVRGSPFARDYSADSDNAIAVDPKGKFAYVVSTPGVSAFSINAKTGALTPVAGSPFAAGTEPSGLAFDPTGKFAYVNNGGRVYTYTINAMTGALKLAAAPLETGQNSSTVMVDPAGKFAYVTGGDCICVYIYAINATTGALTTAAHLGLASANVVGGGYLEGFAIDPTGKFAYVAGGDVYTYTINASTGALKAVAGPKFAVRAGTYPYSVTIDPAGKFAYVLNHGARTSAYTSVSAYTIDATTGVLSSIAGSPFGAGTATDPIASWFNAGRCAAFMANGGYFWRYAQPPPFTRHDPEGLEYPNEPNHFPHDALYVYDPKGHFAYHHTNVDSNGSVTVRTSGPPPGGVPLTDLSQLHTTSGVKLGSTAATVVRLLGQPQVLNGCGLQRYAYMTNRQSQSNSIQFTIRDGKVVEIFEDIPG